MSATSQLTFTPADDCMIRADCSHTGTTIYLVVDSCTLFLTGEQADAVVFELERVRDGETR